MCVILKSGSECNATLEFPEITALIPFSTTTPVYNNGLMWDTGIIIERMVFYTDSLVLSYSDIQAAKQWWINAFDCKVATVPPHWDNPLPSDVALKLPGNNEPTILLNSRTEVEQAGFDRPSPVVSVIFCDKLKKAYEHLSNRGIVVGPIQDGGDMQFFEIRDTERNLIQICKEP
jgi:hypothetical protein